MQRSLGRYWTALRERGVRRLVAERYKRYVKQRLLRKVVYPRLVEFELRGLARANEARRKRLARSAVPPPAGTVYVVICVDAEGPHRHAPYRQWDDVAAEVGRVASPAFRRELADRAGRPFAMNWFAMDWLGPGQNAGGHDLGFHRILDRYRTWIQEANALGFGDELHWHHHHVPAGRVEGYNRNWLDAPRYEEILSRRLIERGVWHVLYRAGNTWEDEACSQWLERFIPFDLSSRGPYRNVHYDWARAPREWVLYHPNPDDVQRPGSQQRFMARCLDIEKGGFRDDEIEQSFLDAAEGRDSYLSFYMHDFRPMSEFVEDGISRIRRVAALYPTVLWQHAGGVELFQRMGRLSPPSTPLALEAVQRGPDLVVETNLPTFGEPWVAVEDDAGFRRVDAVRIAERTWRARVGTSLRRYGVAVSGIAGNAAWTVSSGVGDGK